MKNDRFKAKPEHHVPGDSSPVIGRVEPEPIAQPAPRGWIGFWFAPIEPTGLHCLRVLCGLLFIFWMLPFVGHQTEFYSLFGWSDLSAFEGLDRVSEGATVPRSWSLVYLCGDNPALLQAMWWGTLGVFLLFTLGMATRITSVLTWLGVVSFSANPVLLYEGDLLLIVLAFYLMIGYLLIGQWSGSKSLSSHLICNKGTCFSPLTRVGTAPSHAANLTTRLIQVHFAIIFLTSGLVKLQSADWWRGAALWFPLHGPFSMNLENLRDLTAERESIMFFISLGGYLTLAWLIAFPFFAWRPRWTWLVVGGGAVAWIGSVFVFGEPLFGPIYFIGCLSFLAPEQWQRFVQPVANLLGREQRQESRRIRPDIKPEYSR